jgi:geranylgeranylglycerol-phosphate geranylgeranyltransferase
LVGSTFLFGGLATSPYGSGPLIPLELLVLALLAFFSTIGRELIKGIEDMAGDRRAGVRTFPLVHGPQKAARLAASFLGAAVLLSPLPYVAGVFGDLYLLPLSGSIPAFLLAAVLILREPKPEVAARSSVACKVGMGMGLLAFLAGALS